MKHTLFYVGVFLLVVVQALSLVFARSSQAISYQDQELQTKIIGRVVQLSGNVLKVRSEKQTVQVVLPENVRIQRNQGFGGAQLALNDQVELGVDSSGQVSSVQALSGPLLEALQWSLPVALSGMAMIILGIKLWRKFQTMHTQQFPVHMAHA